MALGWYAIKLNHVTQSAGVVEFTDCISMKGYDAHASTIVMDMTLNCIWWWDSCPGA